MTCNVNDFSNRLVNVTAVCFLVFNNDSVFLFNVSASFGPASSSCKYRHGNWGGGGERGMDIETF